MRGPSPRGGGLWAGRDSVESEATRGMAGGERGPGRERGRVRMGGEAPVEEGCVMVRCLGGVCESTSERN